MRCFFLLPFFLSFLLASENNKNALNTPLRKYSLDKSGRDLAMRAVEEDSVGQLKRVGELGRPTAVDLLRVAYGKGSKLIIRHLTGMVKPTVEESVEMVCEADKGGHRELAKELLEGVLSRNVENTIGLACLLNHPPTLTFVLDTYNRSPYTIFELLVETAINTEDSSYYLALENLLEACPNAGQGFNGQSFFYASMKHGNYQLADILFRACKTDVTYLEPFILTDTVLMAGRFLSGLINEQVKLGRALFIAVKSNHPRSFVDLMEWTTNNMSSLMDTSFAVKTVRMLGRKLEATAISPLSTFCWIEFFGILLGFRGLSLYEKEQIMAECGLPKMAHLLGLLKAYSSLTLMEGDYWMPRELINHLISSHLNITISY